MDDASKIHETVKQAYAKVATTQGSCCGPRPAAKSCGCSCGGGKDQPVVSEAEMGLSCGNPVAFTHLRPGDVALDLGSGGGKDVFAAGQLVGATGKAIGVDMTDEMLVLAKRNTDKYRQFTGLDNVEFRKGFIEELPVDAASVDVVISNCVINLAADKPRVFREVHRVLKPGGKMVVSDIVLNRPLPEELKNSPDLYSQCVAGALLREDYLAAIRAAGFASVEVVTDRNYDAVGLSGEAIDERVAAKMRNGAASVTVMAVK